MREPENPRWGHALREKRLRRGRIRPSPGGWEQAEAACRSTEHQLCSAYRHLSPCPDPCLQGGGRVTSQKRVAAPDSRRGRGGGVGGRRRHGVRWEEPWGRLARSQEVERGQKKKRINKKFKSQQQSQGGRAVGEGDEPPANGRLRMRSGTHRDAGTPCPPHPSPPRTAKPRESSPCRGGRGGTVGGGGFAIPTTTTTTIRAPGGGGMAAAVLCPHRCHRPRGTNNHSCQLRNRHTAKSLKLRDSIYRRLTPKLLLPLKPQPPHTHTQPPQPRR